MPSDGASNNQRLLAAARENNVDLLEEILNDSLKDKGFNINYKDGLGNTALHYAASHSSVDVLEYILVQRGCDVDLINKLEKATPLHLALTKLPKGKEIVKSLLEAGASTSIKDKSGRTATDLIRQGGDPQLIKLLGNGIKSEDIANDSDEDEEGSGSGSESD